MQYTEQQVNEWKSKAEKWDALEAKIAKYYPEYNEDTELDEDQEVEDNGDLLDIGEAAARAFGFM